MRNSKKIILTVVFIAIILCINEILVLALRPFINFRNDIHYLETGEYTDIFVGTSHGKAGINPIVVDEVTGGKSLNMCLGGEDVVDSLYIVKEACRVGKPQKVVYELDPGYWVTAPTLGPEYRTIYNEFPMSEVKAEYYFDKFMDVDFRITLFPWYLYRKGIPGAPGRLKERFSEAYRTYEDSFYDVPSEAYTNHGQIRIHRSDAPKTEFNLALWDENNLREDAMKAFDELVKICDEKGIELMVIITPVPTETLEKYQEHFDAAYTYYAKYMAERNVKFYNYNELKVEGFDKTVEGFSDYEGHMYEDQADIFSKVLGEMLKDSEGK